MKKNFLSWLAPAAFLALGSLATLPACDVIDSPIPESVSLSAGRRDTLALDSAEAALPTGPAVQRVLLEDFTGQLCGNCPRAGRLAETLKATYPDRLIVTEVHVTTFFAKPSPPHYPLDMRVPDLSAPEPRAPDGMSSALVTLFDLENRGLPQGAINRAPIAAASNSQVATDALWTNAVAAQLAAAPKVDLRAAALYSADKRELRLKVKSKYLTKLSGEFRLNVILVEDGIVTAQKDYSLASGTIEDYEHHNVMRAALTGNFGTVQVTNPTEGQELVDYLRFTIPAQTNFPIDDKKIGVIVYISDTATKQILQATQVKIK